ncbi:HAD family hydrolase [Pseudonocardia sp.]|uniref:HAD family hydrolase n=1 Tax=Pseudonocardia sp. TaxID=60912 RepID=UPI00261CAF65|nr:HAD family hydrolase [Pseudonocardia sp.]
MPDTSSRADRLRPGVLFDVDGTLLDTNYLHVLAWSQAFVDTGHPGVVMADIHRAIGMPGSALVRHLLGMDDEATVTAHGERYEPLRERVVAFPRVAELITACAARGATVVLATSGAASDLDWMRPAIGAGDAVAGATTSADVEAGKPAPDLLGVAVEQHGLDPARTVAVGDTVWDVEAARAAGLPCIALECGGIGAAQLREAGARDVRADPADLLERLDDSPLGRVLDRPGR